MLNELPQDAAALIVLRLGKAKVDAISAEYTDAGLFYKRCIREMGHMEGNGKTARIPNKTNAWIEVMRHKKEDEMPEFSHPMIEKAIMSFGGWSEALWAFKNSPTLEKAKYKFQFAYEDVIKEG
jgi:hypothetical protein